MFHVVECYRIKNRFVQYFCVIGSMSPTLSKTFLPPPQEMSDREEEQPSSKMHKCPHCNRSFKGLNYLRFHVKGHLGKISYMA